ncbi:hypothetical protein J6590_074645 [Homalodisca vitripennis]|nr:hypothetical protein J6590_074645 [Homalodisca vitripennis]
MFHLISAFLICLTARRHVTAAKAASHRTYNLHWTDFVLHTTSYIERMLSEVYRGVLLTVPVVMTRIQSCCTQFMLHESHHMMADLVEDEELFIRYFRLRKEEFEQFLAHIENDIKREDTNYMKSITSREWLDVCLSNTEHYYNTGTVAHRHSHLSYVIYVFSNTEHYYNTGTVAHGHSHLSYVIYVFSNTEHYYNTSTVAHGHSHLSYVIYVFSNTEHYYNTSTVAHGHSHLSYVIYVFSNTEHYYNTSTVAHGHSHLSYVIYVFSNTEHWSQSLVIRHIRVQ